MAVEDWDLYGDPSENQAFETFELPGEGPLDVDEAFGEHEIEYWIWHNNRLIPASPDKIARIREFEALRRMDRWRELEQREQRRAHLRQTVQAVACSVRAAAAKRLARLLAVLQPRHARHEAERVSR